MVALELEVTEALWDKPGSDGVTFVNKENTMPAKTDVQAKISELANLVNALPGGEAKAALAKLVNNTDLVAAKVLLEDGKSHPDIEAMVPSGALRRSPIPEGDGHAITCC